MSPNLTDTQPIMLSAVPGNVEESLLISAIRYDSSQMPPAGKLPESTMQKIDALSTSFWAAVNHPDRAFTGLGLLERQRVKVWLERVYAEIDRVGV